METFVLRQGWKHLTRDVMKMSNHIPQLLEQINAVALANSLGNVHYHYTGAHYGVHATVGLRGLLQYSWCA